MSTRKKEVIELLLEALAGDARLPVLARILAQAVKCPVLVTDITGRVLCRQSLDGEFPWSGDVLPPEVVGKGKDCVPGQVIRGVLSSGLAEGIRYLLTPIGQAAAYGYLVVLALNHSGDTAWETWIVQTALACTSVMRYQQAIQAAGRASLEDFVEDLLVHRFSSLTELRLRPRPVTWELDRPQATVVIEIDRPECGIVPAVTRQQLNKFLREQTVEPNYLVVERGDQWVILIAFPEMLPWPAFKKQVEDWVRELRSRTYPYLTGYTFSVGVGSLYANAGETYLSFQQARAALQVGHFGQPANGLTFYEELGVIRLLQRLSPARLTDFVHEALGPLEAYDMEHGTDLLATLRTYFRCEMDIVKTASILGVHTNTLRYRLRRIEELLAVTLEDIEAQTNLYLVLKLAAARNFREGW